MCQVIEDFKISLIEDGKSPKTIESYVGDIKSFIEFLGDKELNSMHINYRSVEKIPLGRKNRKYIWKIIK